jgi:hypothetical protein
MTRNGRQERKLKEAMIKLSVYKNSWKLVQSIESIRQNPDDSVAIFWLCISLQAPADLSLEFG